MDFYKLQSANRKTKIPTYSSEQISISEAKSSAQIVEVNPAHTMTGTLKTNSGENVNLTDFLICFSWIDSG